MASDNRGRFVKPVIASAFADKGLRNDFVEQYYSTSGTRVIRGMHFQMPPFDHAKVVYCVQGSVVDVLLDLRSASPTNGKHITIDLSTESGVAVYIAAGVAHGFAVKNRPATLIYNVTSQYSASHDSGIRWDSFGYDWGIEAPVLSDRDSGLPKLSAFVSPF